MSVDNMRPKGKAGKKLDRERMMHAAKLAEKYAIPPAREPSGQFDTFEDWVNRADRTIAGMGALCFDAKDRRCDIGADFMRARDEGAFPVRYYLPGA